MGSETLFMFDKFVTRIIAIAAMSTERSSDSPTTGEKPLSQLQTPRYMYAHMYMCIYIYIYIHIFVNTDYLIDIYVLYIHLYRF